MRILAPLALIAAVVALVVVISSSGGDQATDSRQQGQPKQGDSSGGGEREKPPKTYAVEPGDSLGTIAEQFGVPVERLQRLNDELDPNTLATGQELKLRK